MKLKILTLILLCPVFLMAQKYDTISNREEFYEHLFDNFQLNKLSTNLLLEQGHPFTRIDYYNGELSDSNYVDETELRKIYATLFTMQIKEKNQLKHYSEIEDLFAKGKGSNDTIYMAGFAFHYNRLIENAISSGEIILKNKKLVNNSNKIEDEFFVEKSMFAMGSLGSQELKQNQTFYLDNKSFFSNNEFKKKDLKVDFGDGNGFRELKPGSYYTIRY
ncbi:hypothetical protein [uncultured Marivirga sp.]|uniref:hypothetical protein n=1 Tax=uncultured Marivirga sp. TaxID=1123707 RepID=UPI0030ED8494|tara:strand:+ start:848 stop:1504 length:657 start_codon:yes stop_codon:yes gene_type:complete